MATTSSQVSRMSANPKLQVLFLMVVTLCMLAPFLSKPYTIDDPVFLRVGQHIVEHPFDPYGFSMNWEFTETPVYAINNNPPLLSYYLAANAFWTQWREFQVHISMLVFSLLAVGGIYLLGRLWVGSGVMPALLLLTSPFFAVSASTVMTDVPMVAFYIWALAFWELGIQRQKWHWFVLGAISVSVSFLTKYFGITALPLMILMCLFQKKAMPFWWVPLLIPVGVVILYEMATGYLYGSGQLTSAWFDAGNLRETASVYDFEYELATGFTFLGASCAAALVLAPLLWKKKEVLFWGVILLLGALLGALFVDGLGRTSFGRDDWPAWPSGLQFGFWAVAGAHLIAVIVTEMFRRRDRTMLILAAWFWGTVIFGVALNWSVTARVLLPGIAASALIITRRIQSGLEDSEERPARRWLPAAAVLVSGTLAFAIAWADTLWTFSVERAADTIVSKANTAVPTYFEGHWGFHWYMEEGGAESVDFQMSFPLQFYLVWPSNNTYNTLPTREYVMQSTEITEGGSKWLSTCSSRFGAGMYSNRIGPVPFLFGKVPDDEYWVLLYFRQPGIDNEVDFPTRE